MCVCKAAVECTARESAREKERQVGAKMADHTAPKTRRFFFFSSSSSFAIVERLLRGPVDAGQQDSCRGPVEIC